MAYEAIIAEIQGLRTETEKAKAGLVSERNAILAMRDEYISRYSEIGDLIAEKDILITQCNQVINALENQS